MSNQIISYLCTKKGGVKKMMSEATKAAHVNEAKGLAKWFKVEFTISIFGHVILHWEYPPQGEE